MNILLLFKEMEPLQMVKIGLVVLILVTVAWFFSGKIARFFARIFSRIGMIFYRIINLILGILNFIVRHPIIFLGIVIIAAIIFFFSSWTKLLPGKLVPDMQGNKEKKELVLKMEAFKKEIEEKQSAPAASTDIFEKKSSPAPKVQAPVAKKKKAEKKAKERPKKKKAEKKSKKSPKSDKPSRLSKAWQSLLINIKNLHPVDAIVLILSAAAIVYYFRFDGQASVRARRRKNRYRRKAPGHIQQNIINPILDSAERALHAVLGILEISSSGEIIQDLRVFENARVREQGNQESTIQLLRRRMRTAHKANPLLVKIIVAAVIIVVVATLALVGYGIFLIIKKSNKTPADEKLPKKEKNSAPDPKKNEEKDNPESAEDQSPDSNDEDDEEEENDSKDEDKDDPDKDQSTDPKKNEEKEQIDNPMADKKKEALKKKIIDSLSPEEKKLVEKMGVVSASSKKADFLLHIVAYFGWTNQLKWCLKAKVFDIEGELLSKTPLHWAAQGGSREATQMLLDYDANIEAKDNNGYTPLHYAASHGKAAALKLLIEKGAAINAQTQKGLSALHLACQGGSKESVKVLLEAGIDVELKTKTGRRMGIIKYGGETAEEMTSRLVSLLYSSEEFVAANTRADILSILRQAKKKS